MTDEQREDRIREHMGDEEWLRVKAAVEHARLEREYRTRVRWRHREVLRSDAARNRYYEILRDEQKQWNAK